jgi:hypothetical protein
MKSLIKKDGGWRVITHLSYPPNWSVNDFINPEICKVKYSLFDKVVEMISALGSNVLCAKMDINQAFHLLVVHPADFGLLGIFFDGKYYINKVILVVRAYSFAFCQWDTQLAT